MPAIKKNLILFFPDVKSPLVQLVHGHSARLAGGVEPFAPVPRLNEVKAFDLPTAGAGVYWFLVHMFKRE
jgi:hypothetical protein